VKLTLSKFTNWEKNILLLLWQTTDHLLPCVRVGLNWLTGHAVSYDSCESGCVLDELIRGVWRISKSSLSELIVQQSRQIGSDSTGQLTSTLTYISIFVRF
jgi:hypothetical protein